MDSNYWKDAYKDSWPTSSKKEVALARWIQETTGLEAEIVGLGAGTDDYISGSAADNGYVKGDADLHIKNTNIYIEVTGPLTNKVPVSSPLWFRPDKFDNAISNIRNGHDTFFAHYCPSENLWRVVHIDKALVSRINRRAFRLVSPVIRGRRETYVEIPANDPCVQPLSFLKSCLLEACK